MSIARSRLIVVATFLGFVIATAARGTGPFRWDAAHYWAATQAMVGALPAVPDGYWELRGIFTSLIYAPAATLTRVTGDEHAGWSVLLQNSIVLAAAAVFLVPAVVRIWRPVTPLMLVLGAGLLWAVTSGFAAYPLVDLYSALGILGLLILMRSDRRWVLLLAGVLAGVAANIRPGYLVIIVLLALVAVIWKHLSGLFVPAGIAVAMAPQVVMNAIRSGTLSPLPAGSDELVALQAGYASYIVRYDTMISDESARQFYCSPSMATLVGDSPPQSGGELALTLLQNIPNSLGFSFEKIGASLAWHLGVPYSAPVRAIDVAYGIGITAIATVGIVALFFAATRRIDDKRDRFGIAVLAAIVAGASLTLVSSATETRFALILVLIGVIGLTVSVGGRPAELWRTGRWWVVAAVIIAGAALVVGAIGVSHPAPRGDVTTAICVST